jgi:hypothetical protein
VQLLRSQHIVHGFNGSAIESLQCKLETACVGIALNRISRTVAIILFNEELKRKQKKKEKYCLLNTLASSRDISVLIRSGKDNLFCEWRFGFCLEY